ncbi:FAD linked oxidase domain protein [Thioalkalivibrio sp. K90mix]|uniref:FAD-linked oxidase C-terminal domain-containing protein n=1 Tax=unclassified Thioalkalivibrio TaxID=2621013 RepID=UPI000195A825|nr:MULTISPECIES: FAD-linked oxidase C-terminal domain-containing protein [unclassified Thioalkalivibrio]ADC71512.1 FAD linked oxidase domain protein [Thioalkalivibrio sp. K90mix]
MSAAQPLPPDSTALDALAAAIAVLQQELPADRLILEAHERRTYECDGLSAYRQTPGAVALPHTREELLTCLRVCREHQVPIVPRGAGTGLSGGALPSATGLLLSLARFNRILEIDADNRCAVVQPGVRNLAISEAAAPQGLYYAPDPSSQIACSIGGNVAENAGGVHCLKYGLTVHNVLGLEMVTLDGEIIRLGGKTLDTAGPDLLALMIGSEGMLGIVTEVTVRLLPRAERTQVLLASFDDVEAAGRAVAGIIAAGLIPAGLEMMDNAAIRAAEDFVHAGYPVDAAAILLCELDGTNAEVSEDIMVVRRKLLELGATEVRTARDAQEQALFWAGRKAAFPAAGRISPDYYCMDGTIPRHQLGTVLERINALSREHGLGVCNVFHAGDGNLHPLILYDANQPGQLETAETFGQQILELCVAVGGTVTGEHGVGVEKLDGMCVQFAPLELEQFHRLRQAFDPLGLLNPGKAVPTLARCAEFGRQHVHGGQLPHPDLPRL